MTTYPSDLNTITTLEPDGDAIAVAVSKMEKKKNLSLRNMHGGEKSRKLHGSPRHRHSHNTESSSTLKLWVKVLEENYEEKLKADTQRLKKEFEGKYRPHPKRSMLDAPVCCCDSFKRKNDGRCCKRCCIATGCQPFKDNYMIAAQVLSIVVMCFSWFWITSFILGLAIMVLLQVPWCCKIRKGGIYTIALVSLLNSVLLFYVGGWMTKQRDYDFRWETNDKEFLCISNRRYSYSYSYNGWPFPFRNYCSNYMIVLAFVAATLYLFLTLCLLHFMTSGRYNDCIRVEQYRRDAEEEEDEDEDNGNNDEDEDNSHTDLEQGTG
eukprot:CAMPEP_0113476702 /NCGR_PEP_ID=MMETSP0014_2-20120614/19809_1 /TAXON_ID=2857 /ORGANISM="Nitzschia sp." /LENGTH=321 /DNA_ID=CAMNT_0000369735 /DNA_START=1348 /DNA_END=2313 /DNA_ORIENTATION=+ /assembly_acc=CAM_ASM_000159